VNDVHISVDIEADGPVPGEYSMLSVGACVASNLAGRGFEVVDPEDHTFYAEVNPLVEANVQLEALKVAKQGLKWHPESRFVPADAMRNFARWVADVKAAFGGARPVFVAYPLSFDWGFTHYYFERFLGQDPFGFSSALDIKSIYAAKAGVPLSRATKGKMPKELTRVKQRHTHNALDDAQGQAELFANVWQWKPDSDSELRAAVVHALDRAREGHNDGWRVLQEALR